MTTQPMFTDSIQSAILAEARARVDAIIEDEATLAANRVAQRLRDIAPVMAMSIMHNFDVVRGNDSILIRVRLDNPPL